MALDPKGKLAGTKAATGAVADTTSAATTIRLVGHFNFALTGTWAGTVNLERSFDDPGGTPDWNAVADPDGTFDLTGNVSFVGHEPEGAWYRVNITVYTSGTVEARLSQ